MTVRKRLEAAPELRSHLSIVQALILDLAKLLQKFPKYEAVGKPVQLLTHDVPTDGSRQSRPSMLTSFFWVASCKSSSGRAAGNPCNPRETSKPCFAGICPVCSQAGRGCSSGLTYFILGSKSISIPVPVLARN